MALLVSEPDTIATVVVGAVHEVVPLTHNWMAPLSVMPGAPSK